MPFEAAICSGLPEYLGTLGRRWPGVPGGPGMRGLNQTVSRWSVPERLRGDPERPARFEQGHRCQQLPQPPPYLCCPRRRRDGRDPLHGHGVPRGRDAGREAEEGAASHRSGPASRRRDRERTRPSPPGGNRASRRQARQRHADQVRSEASGFRPRKRAGRWRPRRGHLGATHSREAPDRGRDPSRHVPVHGAGAAGGKGGRSPDRHFRPRLAALRDGRRPKGLFGNEPG